MKAPTKWQLHELVTYAASHSTEIDGAWVPPRPYGLAGMRQRFRYAWLVFTGKCDAVEWPEDRE